MKSSIRRIISIVLTVILVVGTVAIAPQADVSAVGTGELQPRTSDNISTGDISRSSSTGTVTYSYNHTTKELTISGDGEMTSLQPVIQQSGRQVWSDVETVVIVASITAQILLACLCLTL